MLEKPICWMDLCRRAPKRSSMQCFFGMHLRAGLILSSVLRRNAREAQKLCYQLQMNFKKNVMSLQKLIIASLRNFEPTTVQSEELMQEVAARMIEENIQKGWEEVI